MNIEESLVDKRIEQFKEFYQLSDGSLKFAAIAASRIVGDYSGASNEMAKRIARSASTVENYAHAHWLYKDLRSGDAKARVRVLWRNLPASHWWQAWTIQKAGYDAYHYLNNAELHGWSGRDMMQEFKRDTEAGTAPIVFKRAVISFFGLASELLKHAKQLTAVQIAVLETVQETFK